MKKVINIDLFGKKGLENALKKLKLTEIKCSICEKKISKDKIAAFYPEKKGVGICCDKPECFMIAIYRSKRFE